MVDLFAFTLLLLIIIACDLAFFVASAFTGLEGKLVSIEDTIKGFRMIMNGEVDQYPESAFNLVGTIDEAIEKGEKMLADN